MPLTLLEWEKKYDELQNLSKYVPLKKITNYINFNNKILESSAQFVPSNNIFQASLETKELQSIFDEWQRVYFAYMDVVSSYSIFLVEKREFFFLEKLITNDDNASAFCDILTFYIQKNYLL